MQKECIIYMIDDDLEDQSFFTMALERIDIPHQCIFAESGVQALQRLCSDPAFMPDVIFLDFNMPRMNGLECLQELKKIHRLADVPVYMYSTSRDPEASELCLAEGAAGVLRKLSSIDATTGVLTEVLSSQHAQTF